MMISPESYLEELKTESLEQLIVIRNELIEEIVAFEKGLIPQDHWRIRPSPEVVYQMNLEYLAALCQFISKRYSEKLNDDPDDSSEAG